jgi:hypothetical protein
VLPLSNREEKHLLYLYKSTCFSGTKVLDLRVRGLHGKDEVVVVVLAADARELKRALYLLLWLY